MKENYTFPVILEYLEDDMIRACFPTFCGLETTIKNSQSYIEDIQSFLALMVDEYEVLNRPIPESIDISKLDIKDEQKLIYVNLWMPYFRSKIKIKYVKKTLTIPSYLDILAKEKNINFSSILVKGIKEELGIK